MSDKKRFPLSFPPGMHMQIADQARQNERTMNAEIIYQLSHIQSMQAEVVRLQRMIDQLLPPVLEDTLHG